MAAPTILAIFCPGLSSITSDQVSIIVPVLYPEPTFKSGLRLLLANDPREVIIVTPNECLEAVSIAIKEANLPNDRVSKVRLLSTPVASKRMQMKRAIEAACGVIIVSCDDGTMWPGDTFLENMLPCFDDPKVGAAAAPITVSIPKERQDDQIVTPWETAAARASFLRSRGVLSAYAIARWCWVMGGPTIICRAEILKDPNFLFAYTNDYWLGRYKLEPDDDTFISRWIHTHNWEIVIQAKKETQVGRDAKTTDALITQMFRWERSSIRSFLRTLRDTPEIWRKPWVLRKTVERLIRPILTTIHIIAWILSFIHNPRFTSMMLLYYIWEAAPSYAAFLVGLNDKVAAAED
ncbi:hypothetical protein DL764_008527 [Monosporascus ibericus]|uniref:Glycosyltransferase 2-like domain-containing protein n=1 Tax=Monosporascus ibericus TaxID=155417 RepID=A0A4V1X986_9PEZI|nr:hypothetical protein DL764_008527 [Monosporascus ibericus]